MQFALILLLAIVIFRAIHFTNSFGDSTDISFVRRIQNTCCTILLEIYLKSFYLFLIYRRPYKIKLHVLQVQVNNEEGFCFTQLSKKFIPELQFLFSVDRASSCTNGMLRFLQLIFSLNGSQITYFNLNGYIHLILEIKIFKQC